MITTIVTKYISGEACKVTKQSPDKQFITPFHTINDIEYKLEFVQVIGSELYVIYKAV